MMEKKYINYFGKHEGNKKERARDKKSLVKNIKSKISQTKANKNIATSSREPQENTSSVKRIFLIFGKFIVLFITGAFLTCLIFIFGIYLKYSHEFDKINPVGNATQMVIYDKNNAEIFRDFGTSEPKRIEFSQIPDVIKESTLAAEDLDYYRHGPIDLQSLVRITYQNLQDSDKKGVSKLEDLFKEDAYVRGGGSTITQQLVKNIYLSPEKSFQRKIKEMVFSYKLERKYSKDKIFEMYLNEIYYGSQSLGISNAAKTYFNKDINQLDLAEASMLAGLPQAPTYYSPLGDNFMASKKRQEYVLQKMYLANYITLDEAKAAANESLNFSGQPLTLNKYPYFSQYVKDELSQYFDMETIESRGIKVYTTIDPEKQDIAEKKISEWIVKLASRGASNAATVVADPNNNQILAMVGGVDWNKSKVNVTTAERQPGSSFKPIVYATALENGYSAGTVFIDKYVNFGGNPPYAPRNYDGRFNGYVTMRTALARSLNVPAVEMGKLVGLDKIIDTAHKLGISTLNNNPSSYGLPLSLGSGEVKLVDMVEAFSAFADEGQTMPLTSIVKVVDRNGEEISLKRNVKKQVISPETAFSISSILSDNVARSATFGTNSPLKTDMITAVKTGTTENYSDSWTMGYSPNLVVGVWMGNNDHSAMKKVSGIEGAAYIWHDIITESSKNLPNTGFIKPDSMKEIWISPNGNITKNQSRPNYLEFFKPGTEPKDKIDLTYLKQF